MTARDFKAKKGRVALELHDPQDDAEVGLQDISRARNLGAEIQKHPVGNLQNLYEPIKQQLGPDECERNGFGDTKVTLPFTGTPSKRKVSAAFVYPVVASLRLLLDDAGNWKSDPLKFLQDAGPSLVAALIAFYDEQCHNKPHDCGRSPGSFRAVAAEARAKFAKSLVAEHTRPAVDPA